MKKTVVLSMHVLYWLLYFLLLSFIVFAVAFNRVDNKWLPVSDNFFTWRNMIFFVAFGGVNSILGFYSFYFVIFPRYLGKKKVRRAIGYGVLAILVSSAVPAIFMSIIDPGPNFQVLNAVLFTLLSSFIPGIHGIFGLLMRGFIGWYGDIKIKEELNKKNYETELALVKAQMNPHFLFNTINNIDVLIQKDALKASEYLNKLSDILRFMLYESKNNKILLESEISYIEKYIQLQKIRTSNPKFVDLQVHGNPQNLMTEPMIFIPFIENAFKHAGNKKSEKAVSVRFDITNNTIQFECENSIAATGPEPITAGGLGLSLIEKRLQLLYPENHTLELKRNTEGFKVNLVLLLS